MNGFTLIFSIALLINIAVHVWLSKRQIRHVNAARAQVPTAFHDKISLADHQKAADYTTAKVKHGILTHFISAALLLGWTLGGGLEWLNQSWHALQWGPIATGVAVMISAFVLMSLLETPLSAYQTFSIEERFGFNRANVKTFILDLGKELLVMSAIGIPLAAVVLWLMAKSGSLWWLYVWAVWFGFSLLMMWAYPAFIAPLFNRFTPLEEGELRKRIEHLLSKCGFQSKGIFVMDGSRRSGHGNAYFTGLGANKRIVFFDTLMEQLSGNELEAVLAHELGHFKRHHITKRLISTGVITLLALAILGWLIDQKPLYTGLGVSEVQTHMGLLLFMLVGPLFTLFLQPLMAYWSRKHEFEADEFAATQASGPDLIQALVKLYQENASTLTPDPLYSAFHDSHPPAPVRVAHLAAAAR